MCKGLPSISLMDERTRRLLRFVILWLYKELAVQGWLHLKQQVEPLLHSLYNVISRGEVLRRTAEEPWMVLQRSLLTLACRSTGDGGWWGLVVGLPLVPDGLPVFVRRPVSLVWALPLRTVLLLKSCSRLTWYCGYLFYCDCWFCRWTPLRLQQRHQQLTSRLL